MVSCQFGIYYYFFVYLMCIGIFQVFMDRMVVGQFVIFYDFGINQQLRCMVDGGYWFIGVEEVVNELLCYFVGMQLVRVNYFVGQNQCIIIIGYVVFQGFIYGNGFFLFIIILFFDFVIVIVNDGYCCIFFMQVFQWVKKFYLFKFVGCQDGNFFFL